MSHIEKITFEGGNRVEKINKKGFTLIELLAVIVILAIIALITTPMIMNTIEEARKQAFLDSAYGIIEAGEYFYTENIMNDVVQTQERYDFEVKNKQFVYGKDNTKTLSFKGKVPKTGMLQIHTDGKTAIAICNDTYCACKSISEFKVTLKESNCNIDKVTGEISDAIVKDGTPVGTVISYITGTTAPDGYLICDGSSYQISDYPNLAEAIKNGLGSYNYYGGDGVSTFAVPDLRGEFLRGTGTNSHTNTVLGVNEGSGGNVGAHQEATPIRQIDMSVTSNQVLIRTFNQKNFSQLNVLDAYVEENAYVRLTGTITNETGSTAVYTSRPTNTSVLYCIKY